MADKYWWPSGGTGTSTGNWNSTTNWSSSSASYVSTTAPTSADNANFGSYSGVSAFTVTITNTSAACANLVIDNTNMTWAGTGSTGITISGGVTVTAFSSRTYNGSITLTASSSVTLNFGSMTFASFFTFSGSGTWTLGSALSTTGTIQLFNGTLNTSSSGNYSLTANAIALGAGTKSLILNASTVTLSGTTPVSFATNATGFTFSAGTSQINCTSAIGGTLTFAGGFTFYNVAFTTSFLTTFSITGSNTFNNLSFGSKSSQSPSIVNFGANQTINGTLTIPAGTISGTYRYYLQSSTYGTPITLTGNTASLTDVDFRDITHSGTTWTGTRLGDAGGNSGITFSTPKTVYWNLAGSQNWSATGWATTSSGTPATANFPLPQDTAIFTDQAPVAGSTVTLAANYNLPNIDFSPRTLALTFATGSFNPYAYGSITLSSAITLTGTGIITWGHRSGTKTITSAGRTWTQSFAFSNKTATVLFGDAFSSTGASGIIHGYGTLDAQTYNVTCVTFTTSALNTRTLGLGSGTWTITGSGASAWSALTSLGLTLVPGTSTISMTSASAKTFIGGGKTYYNLNQGGAGALTISGSNQFNNITNSVQPTTVTFTAATTQTVSNFGLSGTSGNLVTINSSTAGTKANLSKSSGTVSCDYLSIQDSSAVGGASWYAGVNSTNVSGVLGWIFTSPSGVTTTGNFFMLFW